MLTSCTTIATHFPGVYAVDVEQGNIIDQEMINQLRPNMNKRQVLYVMGSPMLTDVFHQERWDYVYSNQPGGEDRMEKRMALYFKDEKLIGVQGDFRPSNVPLLAPSHEEIVEVPKRDIQKTLFEKIEGLFSSDDIDTTPPKKATVQPQKTPIEKNVSPSTTESDLETIEKEASGNQLSTEHGELIERSISDEEIDIPAEQSVIIDETFESNAAELPPASEIPLDVENTDSVE